ncbi:MULTISPECIES: N-acetylmuramoyl-L-alanine amidase-like domain-containing protein [unclassified Legionella]|uniref:N-acetylmuramoyl-L-alanine amidase-like domain-containing protein n=1 Tax=unclassified Legionella TaxID=2622702 RepID=UPI001F5FF412|nr:MULTISPECIES: N-acetylmuramoyl-L-alanine amidase-like domain-containing protein [unclassified Legionella]MDI9819781.1 DUF1460 domain-containing protein [Legionella sp. PL877]
MKQVIYFICFTLLLLNSVANANVHPKQQQTEETISKLYHRLQDIPNLDMAARLDTISAQFLGRAYLLGALGEGVKARFDQAPRYRVDAFDCDTYVTTVLALALANNPKEFKQCLAKIRYKDGRVTYTSRNHFTSIDWNKNNQAQGFIKDITETFKDRNNNPVSITASTLIDKPSWYAHHTIKNIRLISQNEEERSKRLQELQTRGANLPKTISQVPYIPFTALFDKNGQANRHLFAQIPNAAIIEIVRPDWNLRKVIGTNLNISHLGFAFWRNGVLLFREASSTYGRVVDVPLIDYLHEMRNSPTIKGINVQIVIPQQPLPEGCKAI